MADKSLRERAASNREDILAFWASTRGLITAGVIVAGAIVFVIAGFFR